VIDVVTCRGHDSIGWVIVELSAEFISQVNRRPRPLARIYLSLSYVTIQEMLRAKPTSLNAISYDAVVRALEKIRDSELCPGIRDVFIDTVGDPETYKGRLQSALGKDFANFTIEKKADATYKVTSDTAK
jgi:hypothetical protein